MNLQDEGSKCKHYELLFDYFEKKYSYITIKKDSITFYCKI